MKIDENGKLTKTRTKKVFKPISLIYIQNSTDQKGFYKAFRINFPKFSTHFNKDL